jgi:hypothetical protein
MLRLVIGAFIWVNKRTGRRFGTFIFPHFTPPDIDIDPFFAEHLFKKRAQDIPQPFPHA